jgi:hypothetical protein
MSGMGYSCPYTMTNLATVENGFMTKVEEAENKQLSPFMTLLIVIVGAASVGSILYMITH